jgi:cystathionine beta-lyase/cystathionine gamma-synthase
VLVRDLLSKWGITYESVDSTNLVSVEGALKSSISKNKLTVVWLETPSNPLLKVTDVEAICSLTRSLSTSDKGNRMLTIVDSTWCSPYLFRPLECGVRMITRYCSPVALIALKADFVHHSLTKYVGGHSDVLGGIIVAGNTEEASRLQPTLDLSQHIGGGVLGPMDSWLILRGLRTLHVRMRQHSVTALELAQFLQKHPAVEEVHYPGLITHPQHALAKRAMKNGYSSEYFES